MRHAAADSLLTSVTGATSATSDNYINNQEVFLTSVKAMISSCHKWRELLGVVLKFGTDSVAVELPCGLEVNLKEPSTPLSPLTPRESTPEEEPAHVTDQLGPPSPPKGSAYAGKSPPQRASKNPTLSKKVVPEDEEEEEDEEDQLNKSRCLPLS